ncbi:TetR/AcrR family transcriptional regulator [uncultured Methanobrevibacter sp.]|uniref:TetR/AcrR family transcriptional regulator n=1 Tax=uncultured Methanobrevibacter sp. TaxID=253161 RepID=UPI002624C036
MQVLTYIMKLKDESTEDKIINATFTLLKENGISKTTTRKIANEAGVNEVTIFRKFKNKKNLLNEVKEVYFQYLLDLLDEIFDYDENISIEDYIKSRFNAVINLSNDEVNIIKIGLQETEIIPIENDYINRITSKVISKLSGFFKLKMEMGEMRELNYNVLALNVFSILFESIVLWKVFDKDPKGDINQYCNDFIDILLNGISN